MYELYRNGSSRCIFERDTSADPQITTKLFLATDDKNRLNTYASDFLENYSALFLHEMNRNKKISDDSKLKVFKDVFEWLKGHLYIYMPSVPTLDFRYYCSADSLALANQLIQAFDTGISSVQMEEISLSDMREMLREPIFKDVMMKLREKIGKPGMSSVQVSMRSDTCFFNIEMDENMEPKVTTLRMKHGDSFFDFGFEEESSGTRRLFDLMDMLLADMEDVVYVVDELECSLHPKLTQYFLKLFHERHRDRRSQLILTTHDSSIMDQDFFCRDEIWFVDRSVDNNRSLYALDRFKKRYDKVFSKAYLEGRYGAVPVFSSFSGRVNMPPIRTYTD